MPAVSNDQIALFQSLFKGREDAFAIRWEKDGKSGYMPAYDLNWDEFAKHKARGGTLKDFPDKRFSKLTQQRIFNHLTGKEVIGLYPLLADNTSWFIAADFDENLSNKKSWVDECRTFLRHCEKLSIPAYLERSRSGKGGHAWIFFDRNYPAYKSRKIVLHILESAGILSPFDKNSNYDRLFPNQDSHSGKGLGNLIALPLQAKALENNNTGFIDPVSLQPFNEQWDYLKEIKRGNADHLDKIFETISSPVIAEGLPPGTSASNQPEIQIRLGNQIEISRNLIPQELIIFLRDNLNFVNSDYIIKKKLGRNTFGTEPYFKMLQERDGSVWLPRGFIGKLLRFCKEKNISYQLTDERRKHTGIDFSFKATLHDYQQHAVETTNKKEMGVIVAPSGSGKTIIGLSIVANKKQPALIIVHRKQLFDQWIERIQSFLGIASPFIGRIAHGQQKIGTHVTVAMLQTLVGIPHSSEIYNSFGTIIIDECHHVPAKTFRRAMQLFDTYYLYGLTATPIRKNNDEKLIFIHIGDVIHEVIFPVEGGSSPKRVSITIRETDLVVPFDIKTDNPETLYQVLIHDSARNQLIIEDIRSEANAGRKVLVLTERNAHIEILRQYLKNKYEVITLSGEDSESARKSKMKQIKEGHFQVLISTGQFFGEGTDLSNLDCLVLAYPFSFEGKMVQYIGRVQRAEIMPTIYDYRDIHIDYLEKQFKQRSRSYRTMTNAGQVHKYDELILIFNEDKVGINSEHYVLPISRLDLDMEIARFKDGIVWKLRVLNYDEENSELVAEIVDYDAKPGSPVNRQYSLQFLVIEKIRFRAIDTARLLHAVELERIPIQRAAEPVVNYQPLAVEAKPIAKAQPVEKRLIKTLGVPFTEIQFENAGVSFSSYIEDLGLQMKFEIPNPDIRPEFEAIKEYFSRVLKKKSISVRIEVCYIEGKIISSSARSEDIDKINNTIIESVRFEFVKTEVFGFKAKNQDSTALNTLENLLSPEKKAAGAIFKSDQDLIDDFLNIKNSKHYHQLKYLSSRHLSTVLKIRFVMNPFSFLFLTAGDKKYHMIWETLNSEEATYIWHFEKSMDALRKGLNEIEVALQEIKKSGKQDYLRSSHDNFSRVMHDYSDVKSGFVTWKGMLEEKLI
jgi:superfamily II DNA or RNA helicase